MTSLSLSECEKQVFSPSLLVPKLMFQSPLSAIYIQEPEPDAMSLHRAHSSRFNPKLGDMSDT